MRLIVVIVIYLVPEFDIVFRSLVVSFRYALHLWAGTLAHFLENIKYFWENKEVF